MLSLRAHGLSDIGRRRRHNEDAFLCDPALGLFIVADGLGGHAAGEVASGEAIDTILGWIRREQPSLARYAARPDDRVAEDAALRVVEDAVKAATYHVHAMAEYDARKAGMGTTASVLVLLGRSAIVGHVGDSRIYRVRHGSAEQLTDDHTLVAAQIREGLLTPEQARVAPHRNVITRAVGSHDYVQVDVASHRVEPHDLFLLCTDGLYGYLAPAEIAQLAVEATDANTRRLIALANERGGKDNITAVLVQVGDLQ